MQASTLGRSGRGNILVAPDRRTLPRPAHTDSERQVLDHLFKLVDLTDDKGAIWNTTNRVVASQYWTSPTERRKLVHGHERAWLNWRGHWGNKEDVDPRKCWWHRLIPICQTISAPPGPNRWFGVAPDVSTVWLPRVNDRRVGKRCLRGLARQSREISENG